MILKNFVIISFCQGLVFFCGFPYKKNMNSVFVDLVVAEYDGLVEGEGHVLLRHSARVDRHAGVVVSILLLYHVYGVSFNPLMHGRFNRPIMHVGGGRCKPPISHIENGIKRFFYIHIA